MHPFDIFLLAASAATIFFSSTATIAAVLVLGLLAMAYKFYIRRFPLVKVIVISLIWALLTKAVPVIDRLSPAVALQAFNTSIFIAALVLLFEIVDSEADRKTGNVNLSHIFGERKTVIHALQLITVCMMTLIFLYVTDKILPLYYLTLTIFYFISFFWIYFSSKKIHSKEHLMITVDILLFLRALSIVVVYYFFLS